MNRCVICGKEIVTTRTAGKQRILCGDPECAKIRKSQWNKKTNAAASFRKMQKKNEELRRAAQRNKKGDKRSLSEFSEEARAHGMSYGQYSAYLYYQNSMKLREKHEKMA